MKERWKLTILTCNVFCVILLFIQVFMTICIYEKLSTYSINNKSINVVQAREANSTQQENKIEYNPISLKDSLKINNISYTEPLYNSLSTEFDLLNSYKKMEEVTESNTEEEKEVKEEKQVIKSIEPVDMYEKYKQMYGSAEVNKEVITVAEVKIFNSEYNGVKMDRYTDLYNKNQITTEQMDTIINNWLNGRESELAGAGQAFIDAANETGYDPIFLLALAANESGWTVSSLHASKSNPYSIAMVDGNPGGGYNLGNTYYEGIVNGAIWINDNFYKKGNKNLHDMIYKGNYASAKDKWINDVLWIMNKSYQMIY